MKNRKGEFLAVEDIENFFEEHKLTENNRNEVFVIDASLGNENNSNITVVFSSKTCLKNLDRAANTTSPMLAIDGTFKVNSLGYPLLCLTTQDMNHRIFPIAFAPCSSECEESISFVLKAVKKAYKLLYKKDLSIHYFMSDCAAYIFFSVSSNLKPLKGHLSCYFHIKENQRKKNLAEHQVAKEDRQAILSHIEIMHTMFNEAFFLKYWSLFKEKYKQYQKYLEYFESTYIHSVCNKWHYFDVVPNTFLTNNISESLNAMIKRDWTNRERKPLHLFFATLVEGIKDLSKAKKLFQNEVNITTEMKIKATKLAEKDLFVKKGNYYFLKKIGDDKIDISIVERFLQLNYQDVNDLKNDYNRMHILAWNNSTKSAICYCTRGFKFGVCAHKLAL